MLRLLRIVASAGQCGVEQLSHLSRGGVVAPRVGVVVFVRGGKGVFGSGSCFCWGEG